MPIAVSGTPFDTFTGSLAPTARAPDHSRPPALDLVLAPLAWMADDARPGAARDGRRVAPSRFPLVLDLEEPTAHGPADRSGRRRALIRTMSQANPLWGAPRIHGELRKLGIVVSQSSIAKCMVRRPTPPSQTWRTFLANHVEQIMAADFFVVPTVTYRLLFVLVILAHDRRRVVHVAVTEHPTSAWTAQQLRNAFPDDVCPSHLLHDRDAVFTGVASTIAAMGIQDVVTAPRSPWQNAYVERFIGSIRHECLDHVIVLNAAGLQRMVTAYVAYYMGSRTHLSLDKDPPIPRTAMPPTAGHIVATPEVHGLHHRYDRMAA